MPCPSYLLQRGSTYYFRSRMPARLVPVFERKEICISLRTHSHKEALLRSGTLICRLEEVFSLAIVQAMSKPTFYLMLERLLNDGTTLRVDFDPEKPILPIHDSFVVKKDDEELLRKTMEAACMSVLSFEPCEIKHALSWI